MLAWLCACNRFLTVCNSVLVVSHGERSCDVLQWMWCTDSVLQWCKAGCKLCSPADAPGKDSERRNATQSLESPKCYWLWQPVKVKTESWNPYTWAVNMDRDSSEVIKKTMKTRLSTKNMLFWHFKTFHFTAKAVFLFLVAHHLNWKETMLLFFEGLIQRLHLMLSYHFQKNDS